MLARLERPYVTSSADQSKNRFTTWSSLQNSRAVILYKRGAVLAEVPWIGGKAQKLEFSADHMLNWKIELFARLGGQPRTDVRH